jgi:hypothetical protein
VQEVSRQHTEVTKQYLQNINKQIRALGIDTSKLNINEIMHGEVHASIPKRNFLWNHGSSPDFVKQDLQYGDWGDQI